MKSAEIPPAEHGANRPIDSWRMFRAITEGPVDVAVCVRHRLTAIGHTSLYSSAKPHQDSKASVREGENGIVCGQRNRAGPGGGSACLRCARAASSGLVPFAEKPSHGYVR